MATKKPLGLYSGEIEVFTAGDFIDIAFGGTGGATKTAGFDNLSPTTTKGDLSVFNGTNNVRLGVGTDTYVLTADSSTGTGLKWAAAAGGGSGTSVTGMLKGNGSAIILAVADVDYASVDMVLDVENGYRIGDKKLQANIDALTSRLLPATIGDGEYLVSSGSAPVWAPGTPILSVTVVPTPWDDDITPFSNKGLIGVANVAYTNSYQHPAVVIKANNFYGMVKSVAETGADSTGNVNGVLQAAVPGTDYATPAMALPTGGTTGQVLAKTSGTNYATQWVSPGAGSTRIETVLEDIGASPGSDTHKFTVAVSGVTTTTKIMVMPTYYVSQTTGPDEFELMIPICVGYIATNGYVTIVVRSFDGGPLVGECAFNILVG